MLRRHTIYADYSFTGAISARALRHIDGCYRCCHIYYARCRMLRALLWRRLFHYYFHLRHAAIIVFSLDIAFARASPLLLHTIMPLIRLMLIAIVAAMLYYSCLYTFITTIFIRHFRCAHAAIAET